MHVYLENEGFQGRGGRPFSLYKERPFSTAQDHRMLDKCVLLYQQQQQRLIDVSAATAAAFVAAERCVRKRADNNVNK